MSDNQAVFVRGNEHLNRLLADPETATEVEQSRAQIRDMDRASGEPGDDPQSR